VLLVRQLRGWVQEFPAGPTFKVTEIKQNFIQGVSRLVDITAGGDVLGLCDQKISHKHVFDFGWLWSYGHFIIPVHALV
jgi:hypothetical protein